MSVHTSQNAVGSTQTLSKQSFLKDGASSVRAQLNLSVCGYVSAWSGMARFQERAINLKLFCYSEADARSCWANDPAR